MEARCFCPKHGKLEMEHIVIRDRIPTCNKCNSALEFTTVRPRPAKKKSK